MVERFEKCKNQFWEGKQNPERSKSEKVRESSQQKGEVEQKG